MNIFLDDTDRRKFLYILSDVVDDFDIEVSDYCLMSNHTHLTVCNRRANLSFAMQQLFGVYGTWWNGRHTHVGHVFQGRFKAQIVQTKEYLASLARYIALNPVRAGLVKDPAEWSWSGYGAIAGLAPTPAFLSPGRILDQFAGDLTNRRREYVRHVVCFSEVETVREERFRSRARVIGDREFKRSILGSPKREREAVPSTNPLPLTSSASDAV